MPKKTKDNKLVRPMRFGTAAVVSYCIHVSPRCVRLGVRSSSSENPLALAVRARLNCEVSVNRDGAFELNRVPVSLPPVALRWLEAYQARGPVEPLSFFLPVSVKTLGSIHANNPLFAGVVELGESSASIFIRPDTLQSNWWRCIREVS